MPLSLNTEQTRNGASQGSLIRGRLISGLPNPVDVYVGRRMRGRRMALGLSQGNVATALGLTFQQIQKYERGENRVSASRLWDLSSVLGCSVSFFFEDMDEPTAESSPRNLVSLKSDTESPSQAHSVADETSDLLRAYYRITGVRVRRGVYELTQSLAAAQDTFPK